jgi:hypothetical protein
VLLASVGVLAVAILFSVCKIRNQWTLYSVMFTTCMLIGFYTITGYRTWMLFYKSKLQLLLGSFEVDEILRAGNRNAASIYSETTRAAIGIQLGTIWDKFLINRRRSLGSSTTMSKVFIVFGICFVIVNLTIASNGEGIPCLLESPFQAYDCYNIAVCLIFIVFNLMWTGYTRLNFRDSFRFTGEVLMESF